MRCSEIGTEAGGAIEPTGQKSNSSNRARLVSGRRKDDVFYSSLNETNIPLGVSQEAEDVLEKLSWLPAPQIRLPYRHGQEILDIGIAGASRCQLSLDCIDRRRNIQKVERCVHHRVRAKRPTGREPTFSAGFDDGLLYSEASYPAMGYAQRGI